MAVCTPFAWVWMQPGQLKDFSESLVAVSLFVSNFLFWSESGYFAAAAEEKPLLHTWSLAVEEQYYLIFPILLTIIWRFGKNRVFWIIISLAITSLLFSEFSWRTENLQTFSCPIKSMGTFGRFINCFNNQKKGCVPAIFYLQWSICNSIFSLNF